ncbi:diguanylate cyclase [Alcaligenes sp. WGS1538]|uniref:diguanylate cyclase n=1 Tax=Alcaligenes sp. WGS1538 TaxID=3366811 RepID=UPI00372D6F1C
MPQPNIEESAQDWHALLLQVPLAVRAQVLAITLDHQDELATHFYTHMLTHPAAQVYLSHEQVQTRLHRSLRNWLVRLFSVDVDSDMQEQVKLQNQVGEVHARVGVPVHLVLRGARLLKGRYARYLFESTEISREQAWDCYSYVQDFIDLAMEIMSHAYANSRERKSRAEESYRLFAIVQNAAAERGRQRAALLDWENQFMFAMAVNGSQAPLPRIGDSDFGVWFKHKGSHAFQGTVESREILELMRLIDAELVPGFDRDDQAGQIRHLHALRDKTRAIGLHLERLFEQQNELESGRDVLTRLLSRKYLPVVLSREVSYAQQRGSRFALLGVDIDYFKSVNDTYGHDAGDRVLQQFAELLSNSARAGDYVFRLGGEEFLVLLVDVDADAALRAARNLRMRIHAETFRVSDSQTLSITASVGIALYDGHPDYERTLRRVDRALYQAKEEGRDRVVFI